MVYRCLLQAKSRIFQLSASKGYSGQIVLGIVQGTKDGGNLDHFVPVQSLLVPPPRSLSLSGGSENLTDGEMIGMILRLPNNRDYEEGSRN